MKLEWERKGTNTWVGTASELRFASTIEFSPRFNAYFVDGTSMSYGSLISAKIAAAKTAARRDIVVA